MKIGFIRYPQKLYSSGKVIRGGSEIANQYIIDFFKNHGEEVIEFEPKNDKRIDLISIPALGTPLMFQDLLNQMDEINKCDVIFTTNWFGSIFPEIKKPIITIFHHDAQLVLKFSNREAVENKAIFNKWLKKLSNFSIGARDHQTLHDQIISIGEQELAKRSKKNIAVSQFLKDNLISDYNLDPNKIAVVFNSFPSEWKDIEIKKDFREEKLNLTCITRLPIDEAGLIVKGIDRLFEILAGDKICKKTLIASTKTGIYQDFFKTNFKDIEYVENASRDNVAKNLKKSHITIHTSRCESFGLSIVESMMMGNVPIAFPTGVVEELIIDGKNGFIVKDCKAAIRTIKKLNNDRILLEKISVQARETILREMSIDVIGEKYLKIIKEVI